MWLLHLAGAQRSQKGKSLGPESASGTGWLGFGEPYSAQERAGELEGLASGDRQGMS